MQQCSAELLHGEARGGWEWPRDSMTAGLRNALRHDLRVGVVHRDA